jgi:hypothetical protein
MITGTEPKTMSVPFKVLLVTLFAVARVDSRIKKGTEGRKHTVGWLFNRSIFFACSVRQQMVCQWKSSIRQHTVQSRPWDKPVLDPWSWYLIKNLLKKKERKKEKPYTHKCEHFYFYNDIYKLFVKCYNPAKI